jgi:hypothetical protein
MPDGLVEKCVRRRPTLPRGGPRSTIGAERLSFRVRDGTGRFPLAMVAVTLWRCSVRTDPPVVTWPAPGWGGGVGGWGSVLREYRTVDA